MATEATRTHASLVCEIRGKGASDIVAIQRPPSLESPAPGIPRQEPRLQRVAAHESSRIMGPTLFAVGLDEKARGCLRPRGGVGSWC